MKYMVIIGSLLLAVLTIVVVHLGGWLGAWL